MTSNTGQLTEQFIEDTGVKRVLNAIASPLSALVDRVDEYDAVIDRMNQTANTPEWRTLKSVYYQRWSERRKEQAVLGQRSGALSNGMEFDAMLNQGMNQGINQNPDTVVSRGAGLEIAATQDLSSQIAKAEGSVLQRMQFWLKRFDSVSKTRGLRPELPSLLDDPVAYRGHTLF